MSNCPECERKLKKDADSCVCGWKNENLEPVIKQCFTCHKDIERNEYFRGWKSPDGYRYKCGDCLLTVELDWRDKLVNDWLDENSEFKCKPEPNEREQFRQMCLDKARTGLKQAMKLPYSKTDRQRS